MSKHIRTLISIAILSALACSRATEPGQDVQGSVTLRFERAPAASMVAGVGSMGMAAAALDTAVVRVFRPGTPITEELSRVVDISGGSVDISIPCIAESGKRVSVDLYEGGKFTHHGFATGVSVVKGVQTPVSIDAYKFTIAAFNVTPSPIATEPEPFDLAWSGAPAATSYDVQASATSDFATIQWEQSVTDTVLVDVDLAPGGHYFRVVPRTPYATGQSCPEHYAYLQSSSQDVVITSLSVPAAKPLDVITIFGENFDYPGTQVWIGSAQMQILSSSWGELEVLVPRAAITESITVLSGSPALGSDTEGFVVQRVAYVTSGGAYTSGYVTALEKHDDDFGFSGVAVVRLPQVDTQDMTVFDVIIVAGDTGTNPGTWGGDIDRATKIHETNANVLAMGRGGAIFLTLVGAITVSYQTQPDDDGRYYVGNGSAQIFSAPHSVGGGNVTFNGDKKPTTTWLDFDPVPPGVNHYASTACDPWLLGCTDNLEGTLADFRFQNAAGDPVLYFFWGYSDDPEQLTSNATDILGNIMYMLYQNRTLTPVN